MSSGLKKKAISIRGVVVAVRAVDRIGLDRFRVDFADRPFGGLLGVGRAHDLAVAGDCVLAFENLHDDWTGRHEAAQIGEERTFPVDGIETLGLVTGHPDAPRGYNAQSGLLQHLGDGAGEVAAGGVGLDDRKGARRGHDRAISCNMKGLEFVRRLARLGAASKPHAFLTHLPSSRAQ